MLWQLNSRTPSLPVLNDLEKIGGDPSDYHRIIMVCVQHILPTTVSLFSKLIKMGVQPQNIFLMGKHYSTCVNSFQKLLKLGINIVDNSPVKQGLFYDTFENDIQKLWDLVQSKIFPSNTDGIIALDDGGHCLSKTPREVAEKYRIIGIEQTTSGLYKPEIQNLAYPLIMLATSAAKRSLESPIIASAIAKNLTRILPSNGTSLKCGIVGYGAIGQALANHLNSKNLKVYLYDSQGLSQHPSHLTLCDSLDELYKKSSYIFGCTGKDSSQGLNFNEAFNNSKTLISCSSGDIEFISLIKHFKPNKDNWNSLSNINIPIADNINICIMRGGYPYNFNNSYELEPPQDIQFTRGLLLGSIIQAKDLLFKSDQNNSFKYILDPNIQRYVVNSWYRNSNRPQLIEQIIKLFNNLKWIISQSTSYGGTICW